MLFRRFGRPGLLGLAARTAVVAGTASAVGGAMRARQQRSVNERAEAEAWETEQTPPPPTPMTTTGPPDLLGELERLSKLRGQGLLTDDEFATAKQRLLGT